MSATGPLALVGGGEWQAGCKELDTQLLEASGGTEVLVLPTGAAYEHPEKVIEAATAHFAGCGATVKELMVLRRPDAEDAGNAAAIAGARFIYLTGGSPLHMRSVLKETKAWLALLEAWHAGAVIAGSSAGAMVLGDPMVDPRGGAFTLGLGLIEQLAIVPQHNTWPEERAHRTMQLAPKGLAIAAIDEQTAIVRDPDGTWHKVGAGAVAVFVDGQPADLSALPG